jgi:long-chain acyl-CoA synthetase
MLVHEFFEISADRYPDKTALIFKEKRLTYALIESSANKLANALIKAGLRRGDRVSIFMDNSAESVISIYGVLKAGGVFSTLSPTLKTKKLEYILNNSESSFFISQWNKYAVFSESASDNAFLKRVIMCGNPDNRSPFDVSRFVGWEEFLNSQDDSRPDVFCIDMDLANIVYTSGSTGDPKGVMMSHLSMASAATSIMRYLENDDSDIILNVLPLSFDYGLYQVIMAFMFGGTVVLEKSFAYPYVVIDKIIKEKVTGFPVVPTIVALLFQLKKLETFDFRHLRYLSNTGAALPVHHIRKLRSMFPHVKIYSMYGLTECKRVSYLSPDELDGRPGSVGKGMPNEEVYIVNSENERVGPGVVGELVVRGSNVMKGYWRSPAETDKVLRPGPYPGERVLYTGDLFKTDEEGYLYFVARKDDLIKTRGERVSPKEVENTLYEIDGVSEAAVIGVPDEILGNAIKAFIVAKDGSNLTPESIMKYCTENLEAFMVPRFVEFIASFSKTGSGKIDKKLLK